MVNSKWVDENGERVICAYEGCQSPVRCQGMCSKHYQHFYYMSVRGEWR